MRLNSLARVIFTFGLRRSILFDRFLGEQRAAVVTSSRSRARRRVVAIERSLLGADDSSRVFRLKTALAVTMGLRNVRDMQEA